MLFSVLQHAAKCLLPHTHLRLSLCVCVCVYIDLCVPLISFRLFQIGTGFKDEDLEQHYKFLKVKCHSKAVALTL